MSKLYDLESRYRAGRDSLDFFDCNAWIGRPPDPGFWTPADADELLAYLCSCGVRRAVLSHLATRDYDPSAGNEILLDAVATRDDCVAAVVLTPEMAWHVGEQGTGNREQKKGKTFLDIDARLDDYIRRKARMVRLFPRSHNFSLSGWCSGGLLDAISERRMPLILWHTETNWETVERICGQYPDLPVVVEGTPRKILYDNRLFYAAMERRPNLYLELHNLINYLGLEDMVSRFGAGRLLYGSYMPICDPNAVTMMVTEARIPAEEKTRIASGNLEELLAGVRVPS